MKNRSFDIVIIGAGLAGLSTAYYLVQKKAGRICILDRASKPGLEASSQNASMICRTATDPVIGRMSIEGAERFETDFLRNLKSVPFVQSGSLFIADSRDMKRLSSFEEEAARKGVSITKYRRAECRRRFPFLGHSEFDEALYSPLDGVTDSWFLTQALASFLREHGVDIRLALDARFETVTSGSFVVRCEEGNIDGDILVNAGGAWAGEIAKRIGAQSFEVTPKRRHLFVSEALPWVDANWPIVWDLSNEVYCRTGGGRLYFSPCDETDYPAGAVAVDPVQEETLRDKLLHFLPRAASANFERVWAGLRTFSPDRQFVIGWDGVLPNFFWAGCLDGHGLVTSAAVGHLAASWILGAEDVGEEIQKVFSPKRFLPKTLNEKSILSIMSE